MKTLTRIEHPKSDYSYKKVMRDGYTVIVITDLNLGGISVTNDIENVVEYICKKDRLNIDNCTFIYRDSMGTWDGWNPKNGWFVALSTTDKKEAIAKIVKWKHHQ